MLDEVLDDGTTQRDNLIALERQTGVTPEQLEPVDCPEEYRYLWDYFLDISRRRGSNGFGPNPVSHAELLAWETRRGIKLEKFEQRALDVLEIVYLNKVRAKK